MDTQSARGTPLSSEFPSSSPASSVTSESPLETEIKARIDEIERQRDEESAAMSNRLYSLIMEYKRRDQALVDRHTKHLDRLSRRLPAVAKTRLWAMPCRGVVEREFFFQGGLAIKFYPSTLTSLPPPQAGTVERETVTTWKLASTTTAVATKPTAYPQHSEFSSLLLSSPLSKVGSPSDPIPGQLLAAPHTPEAQLLKRPKRPPSPDELTLIPSAISPPTADQNKEISEIPEQGPRRKRTRTDGRKQPKQPRQPRQPRQAKQPRKPRKPRQPKQSTEPKQSAQPPSTPVQEPSSLSKQSRQSPSTPAQ